MNLSRRTRFSAAFGLLFIAASLNGCAHVKNDVRKQETPALSAQTLPVSLVQFPVRGGTKENVFLADVERIVLEAKQKGSRLVVFPELLSLDMIEYGELADEKRQIEAMATDFFPRYLTFVKNLAAREKIDLLAGSLPRKMGAKIRNTALFVSAEGKVIFQDKLFLTPDEVRWGWEGGSELKVWKSPFGNWVILICYDSQFAELSSLLGKAAPSLIFVPSMTGAKGLNRVRFAAQARAVEHHAYVAVAGTVSAKSPDDPVDVGQNLMIPPQDEGFPDFLAEGPRNVAATVSAALDFAKLERSRTKAGIYSSRDFAKRSPGLAREKFRVVFVDGK